MPQRRLAMRRVRELLRMRYELELRISAIALRLGISSSTVHDHIERANTAGITWPLPPDVNDEELEIRLFRTNADRVPEGRPVPDWATVGMELKRKGVTLKLLWWLCRCRHNIHYADRVVMPIRPSLGVGKSSLSSA